MKKLAVVAAAALGLVVMVSMAFAYGGGRGHGAGFRCGDDAAALLSARNLSAEQTAKIEALRIAHMKEVKPLQDMIFSKRGDMRLLCTQENPDPEKIRAIRKEARVLRDQLDDKRFAFHSEVLKVLTPEQKNELKSRMAGWRLCDAGAGSGMGRGMHGDGAGLGMGRGMRGDCW